MYWSIVYRRYLPLVMVLLLSTVMVACQKEEPSAAPVELLVAAPVSLSESLLEIKGLFEANIQSQIVLNFHFAATGALRHQIDQGAPIDLLLTADVNSMDVLVQKGWIDTDHIATILENELVVVVPKNSHYIPAHIEELIEDDYKHLAIGEPYTVPAGAYAQESLIKYNMWELIRSKAVYGNNVRQVLSYVETENSDVGFVYKTDALLSEKVNIAFSVDAASHHSIQYLAGIVKQTKHPVHARMFYQFLTGEEALGVFQKHGFKVLGPDQP